MRRADSSRAGLCTSCIKCRFMVVVKRSSPGPSDDTFALLIRQAAIIAQWCSQEVSGPQVELRTNLAKEEQTLVALVQDNFSTKGETLLWPLIRLPAVFCQRLFPFSNITPAEFFIESSSNPCLLSFNPAFFVIASRTLPFDQGRSYLLFTRVETTFQMQKFINFHFHPDFCVIFFIRDSIKLVDEFSTTTTL